MEVASVLIVASEDARRLLTQSPVCELSRRRLRLTAVAGWDAALEALVSNSHDVCIVDQKVGQRRGLDLLREAIKQGCVSPAILLIDSSECQVALEATRAGAGDCLVKGRLDPEILHRAIRYALERKRSEDDLRESYRFLHSTLDSLAAHIAILDESGMIIAVNEAWRRFAEANGFKAAGHGVGANYFEACEAASGEGAEEARAVARGTREVLAGEREDLLFEYRCDSPRQRRWFEVSVTRFAGPGPNRVVVAHQNITKRKQAEELLREGEALYRDLFENANDIIYTTDLDGRFNSINRKTEELTGYSAADAMGLSIGAIVAPEYRQFVLEKRDRKLAGQDQSVTYRVEIVRKDGRRLPVEVGTRLIWKEGKPVGFQGIARDISERKRAEEAASFLSAVVESSAEGIMGATLDGTIVSWNPGAESICGYTAEEIIGKPVSTLVPRELRGELLSIQNRLRRGESTRALETVRLRKDGSPVHVSLTVSPLRDKEGRVVGSSAVASDITERKQAADAVRQSEERFHALIEHAADLIAILDADGLLRYVSPPVERILGYSPAEFTGRSAFEVLHPEDVPSVAEALRKGKEGVDTGEPICFRLLHKDGSWRTLEATDTNLLNNEAVKGIVINARDVTERLRLEEQLRQAQRMEAVGRLAGGVAHDFNNLLTAISGYSELLLRRLDDGDPMRREVGEVRKAADRAASLTRQLLAFSRKQVLQARVLDLNAVVTDMDRMLRRLIGEDIELTSRLSAGLGHVKADPGQIEQVIMNLAVNARDAMPNGGKLTIETANVDLDSPSASKHTGFLPGQYVMLAVSDNGCGMDRETQSRIFEPFFTTKELGRGTGLGLSTVYGIIKQSGGDIKVYSEPGVGTSFKIYLPFVNAPADALGTRNTALESPRGSETVLLVEDDDGVRMLAREILDMSGYTVLEARHGREALRLCEGYDGSINLLITDVVMPQMSGRELAERLLPQRPGMKLLYMSGYTDDAIVHHGVLDSGLPYIQKPFTPAALAHKLREVLDARR